MITRDEKGRFTPGSVANPNGRPKKECSITHHLREKAELEYMDGKSRAEYLAELMWKDALEEGDKTTRREILDRLEGRPQIHANIETEPILYPVVVGTLAEDYNDDGSVKTYEQLVSEGRIEEGQGVKVIAPRE